MTNISPQYFVFTDFFKMDGSVDHILLLFLLIITKQFHGRLYEGWNREAMPSHSHIAGECTVTFHLWFGIQAYWDLMFLILAQFSCAMDSMDQKWPSPECDSSFSWPIWRWSLQPLFKSLQPLFKSPARDDSSNSIYRSAVSLNEHNYQSNM
jgi:hypothetical protein